MFVLEFDLDLSCVLPLAPGQEQAAVTCRCLYLCVVVVLELFSLSVPHNLNGFMAKKVQSEDSVVPNFKCHRLAERTEVFRVKSGGIYKKW